MVKASVPKFALRRRSSLPAVFSGSFRCRLFAYAFMYFPVAAWLVMNDYGGPREGAGVVGVISCMSYTLAQHGERGAQITNWPLARHQGAYLNQLSKTRCVVFHAACNEGGERTKH